MKFPPSVKVGHSVFSNYTVVMVLALICLGWGVPQKATATAPMFAKGARTVHGSFSFSSGGQEFLQNSEGDRTQEWTIAPAGGYFIAPGLALKLAFEGTWFAQGDISTSEYSLGPVVEYYFDTIKDASPRGHAVPYLGAGYLWGTFRESSAESNAKYVSGLFTFTGGLAWMLADHLAFDIAINFKAGEYTAKIPHDGEKFSADRWSVFLGLKGFIF